MIIDKSQVVKLLGISTLDNEIIYNVLELCEIKLEDGYTDKYDGEDCCKFYSKAKTFFHEYLPEIYVSELLELNINQLNTLDLEYRPIPAEMQYIFYDYYPYDNYRLSKYAYDAIQVYKMLNILSKSVFLEIPLKYSERYKTSFISEESAVKILRFSKVNPALYHYYLMQLDVRFTLYNSNRLYLIDDIINLCERADEMFEQYISFNEACDLYGYPIIRYLCNEYSLTAITGPITKYDIIYSDVRYKYFFKNSYSFLLRDDVKKMYNNWFYDSSCNICSGIQNVELVNSKFNCSINYYDENEDFNLNTTSRPLVSVFDQRSFLKEYTNYYEKDPEFEKLEILCKVFELDCFKKDSKFEILLKKNKFKHSIMTEDTYDVFLFKQEYTKAVYFKSLIDLNIITTECNNYIISSIKKESINYYFSKAQFVTHYPPVYVHDDTQRIIPYNIIKYWNNADNDLIDITDYIITFNNEKYISFKVHQEQCLKFFYTSKLFDLFSGIGSNLIPKMYVNMNFKCTYNSNISLQKLIYNDFEKAVFLNNEIYSNMSVTFLRQFNLSNILNVKALENNVEYWTIYKVLEYLDLLKYSLTISWFILYSLELNIIIYDTEMYINASEIKKIKAYILEILSEYMTINDLYYLLHKKRPAVINNNEIIVPPGILYFLMPDNRKGFYFIKRIPNKIIDEVYNEHINCITLLTYPEVSNDFKLLPNKLPTILALQLLKLNKYGLNEINKTYHVFTNLSNDLCKRETVIKIIKLQKEHEENYVMEDNIPSFLNLNIESLSQKDKEILLTIPLYIAPPYIKYKIENVKISNDKCYLKADLIGIKNYFHVSKDTHFDIKIDNNIMGKDPYNTYNLRLTALNYGESLKQLSIMNFELWDGFIKNKLIYNNCSNKVLNGRINQSIKTLYLLINLLNDYNITNIMNLKTGMINRYFNKLNSPTYNLFLMDFFKYCTIEFINKGIKADFRFKELKLPISLKEQPEDILPQIYSFTEYSKLFNYCNNYYVHIEKAINEIIDNGTCVYASTWFYVMSHLNNAWRSSDFAMFPYIDIVDIVQRNMCNDIDWFLNNKLSKSDSTIIVLRIQNNPKIISKTKKYTRFTCSDALLETYATVYSLLIYYNLNYLSYDFDYVTHFGNKYNGVSKAQLNLFFLKYSKFDFQFKSRRLNKTLLTMIDYIENYYSTNDLDIERRQAMLLRSHVNVASTVTYIKKSKEVFDCLTNMICVRGEFGYAYEMMIKSTLDNNEQLSMDEMTERIRKMRFMLPNISDIDTLYGFLNYTNMEFNSLNEYINSLPLEELQLTLTKLYLNHLGSKADKNLSCIKKVCINSQGKKEDCSYCLFHIPSIYSLSIICQSIKENINIYSTSTSNISRKKTINKIIKMARDLIWARDKYGDEILSEVLAISGTDFNLFMISLDNVLVKQNDKVRELGDL